MASVRATSRSWAVSLLAAGSALLLILGPRAALSAASARPLAQLPPSGIFLNEFMPHPISDWNDDGVADQGDEYIELYNSNPFAVDLSGWILDGGESSGAQPYTLPPGTVLSGQHHLVLFGHDTGIELDDHGGALRLLGPDGVEMESTSYAAVGDDVAYSKTTDGGSQWTTGYPPSPGATNLPPSPVTPTSTGTATATATSTPTPTATAQAVVVSLNEFMPNPEHVDWNKDGILGDGNDEYIELYNANDFAVDLSGWRVDDVANGGSTPYTLPAGTTIPARGFLALWSRDTGIALNNSGGDSVRLLRPDGVEVESTSYTQTSADQAYSKTVDGGDQWTRSYPPSPGASNQPAPTPTPTPTATPGNYPDGVSLNEYMPNPEHVDWNDDGILGDGNDEYIELYNANDFAVDLSGWRVDDVANGGSTPYTLPAGTTIPARGFLALWSRDTGIALNNSGGDSVRLLRPDGVEVESTSYTQTVTDEAYSKTVDGGDEWTRSYPPSPGASNQPPAWTATPTATAASSATPTATAAPSATPTATPGNYPAGIGLNEFMPNPQEVDWNDDGILGDGNDEYIELHNANDFAVDLSGWRVDDVANGGSTPYTLPAGTTIPARGFLALWSRDTGIALNNSGGDSVRLLRPDGVEVESASYTAAPADGAHSKTVDGGDQWTLIYPPSPGASNQPAPTPTPTPTATPGTYPDGVSLNEYMPDPASDWNGDGVADQNDEYIELYNANDFAVDLSGWRLDDVDDGGARRFLFGPDGSPPYTLPSGAIIPARGFLLVFRSQSGIALNNDGDWVRLLRPDGVVVEETEYSSSRDDEAYSKTVDGGSEWTRSYPPSPGASNQPAPTPTPTPTATPGTYPDGVSLNEYMPNPEHVDW
ncbi:MAG TPA: lamin tail domain-containing protein, partial [Anaerolineae bacterium]|nr:lamin tail domain-containing protein [Anaerolineae bacterium]